MSSITNMFKQLKDGNYHYVLHRARNIIFPVPNPIFYWDKFVMIKGVPENKTVRRTRKSCNSEMSTASCQKDYDDLLEQFPHHPYNKDRIAEDGAILILARRPEDGRINGYSWIKISDQPFVTNAGMQVGYSEDRAAWGYGFYVLPECRLSSVFLKLTQEIRRIGKENDINAIYSETAIDNVRSIRSFEKVGKHVYEKVLFVSLFGFKLFIVIPTQTGGITFRLQYAPKTHQVLAIRDA